MSVIRSVEGIAETEQLDYLFHGLNDLRDLVFGGGAGGAFPNFLHILHPPLAFFNLHDLQAEPLL